MMTRNITWVFLALALAACGSQPQPNIPGVKIGKPYVIEGKTYYPEYDSSYDRTGEASWYGPGFHGKYTANGEIFDQDDLTAAHPTLPMPSLVRVTNLENGKSLIVRVNDRGPFKKNRIIDLSRASAQRLGIHSLGRVRVQFLKPETEQYLASRGVDMDKINDTASRRMIAQAEPPLNGAQIVESTVATSQTGQPINDSAPIMTVSSGELEPDMASQETGYAPVPRGLVRDAYAEAPVPEPVLENESAEPAKALPRTVQINANETITEVEESSPATGQYVIQAGSFSAAENAHKLSSRLTDHAKVITEQVEAAGRTWWRVRVGPFMDRSAAEFILDKVRSSGAPDARIIRL